MTKIHEYGIYFGLDEDEYHADPALGSTGVKDLYFDPVEYQHEILNPTPKDWQAPHLVWGSALHARTLEGRSAFDKFSINPNKADYEDLLDTMKDLEKHADMLGIPSPRKKTDLISAIRDFDKDVPIWDEIYNKYQDDLAEKPSLTKENVREIEAAAEWMQRDPLLEVVMEDGTFCGGGSEVSIFYDQNGLRRKARLDFMGVGTIVDLKSWRSKTTRRMTVQRAFMNELNAFRYDIQAADYLQAWKHGRFLWETDRVFGKPPSETFLEEVYSYEVPRWIWVMMKANGAPQPLVVEFSSNTFAYGAALDCVNEGVENYLKFCERYGKDEIWYSSHPVLVLANEDFPPWFGQK